MMAAVKPLHISTLKKKSQKMIQINVTKTNTLIEKWVEDTKRQHTEKEIQVANKQNIN